MTTMTSKFATLAAALALAGASAASHAAIVTLTGNTTGAPTYTRALEDFSALSTAGAGVHYNTLSFTVSTTGAYSFVTTGAFDTFVFLYQGVFNPASPLANGIVGNDDLLATPFTTSGLSATLSIGTAYTYVTTGFSPTDFGAYSTTIGGPGTINPVPEPETLVMMLAGLGAIAGIRLRSQARRRDEAIVA